MKRIILSFAIIVSVCGYAQFNHEAMFASYLSGDLSYWGESLRKVEKQCEGSASRELLRQVVNYEYGYIPWCLSVKKQDEAKYFLSRFEQHCEQLAAMGESGATVAVYRSAQNAYQLSFNKWKFASYASKAFNYASEAVKIDGSNPLALSLKGNVEFYCPSMFGGSKREALRYFNDAIASFEKLGATQHNWNYVATMLCCAQAYEKLDNKAEARAMCEKILGLYPDFVYVCDVYFPQLKN